MKNLSFLKEKFKQYKGNFYFCWLSKGKNENSQIETTFQQKNKLNIIDPIDFEKVEPTKKKGEARRFSNGDEIINSKPHKNIVFPVELESSPDHTNNTSAVHKENGSDNNSSKASEGENVLTHKLRFRIRT